MNIEEFRGYVEARDAFLAAKKKFEEQRAFVRHCIDFDSALFEEHEYFEEEAENPA